MYKALVRCNYCCLLVSVFIPQLGGVAATMVKIGFSEF